MRFVRWHFVSAFKPRIGTVVVFLLVYIPIVLYAIVSSQVASSWMGHHYSHGWPLVYLERHVGFTDEGACFLWRGATKFSLFPLAVNIAFSALVALAVTFLWHLHVSKHHWWRFSLKEMLGLVTASAVALGYCYAPVVEHRQELAIIDRLQTAGWVSSATEPGPNWILRPVVELGLVDRDCFWHPSALTWEGYTGDPNSDVPKDTINKGLNEAAHLLPGLRYCDEITIKSRFLTDEGVKTLCTQWKHCRRATLGGYVTDEGLGHIIKNWPELEELDLSGTNISDEGLLATARLPHLKVLNINGAQNTTLDGAIKLMERSKSLKKFYVPSRWRYPSFRRPTQANELFQQAKKYGIEVCNGDDAS